MKFHILNDKCSIVYFEKIPENKASIKKICTSIYMFIKKKYQFGNVMIMVTEKHACRMSHDHSG